MRRQIQQICRGQDVEILQGHVRPDRVHLLLRVPPHLSPSRVMQAVKGKTSHRVLMDHRRLRKDSWGRRLWARGYFVASSGNVVCFEATGFGQWPETQDPKDLAGHIALETAHGFLLRLALVKPAGDIAFCTVVDAHPRDDDHVQGGVRLTVAFPAEPVTGCHVDCQLTPRVATLGTPRGDG